MDQTHLSFQLLFLKPILTSLIVPPAGPLLIVFLGLLVAVQTSSFYKRLSFCMIFVGSLTLWTLSCENTALWLSKNLLTQYSVITPKDLSRAQAIVVLGGGTQNFAQEYSGAELTPHAFERLRYAVYLAKSSVLPLAYAGGTGWADTKAGPSEAQVARATLKREWGLELPYAESNSKDTRQNAQLSYNLLAKEGVVRIALVTHAWHMPRSFRNFTQAGFEVIPAPMGFITESGSPILDALPSEGGLQDSRWVIREWLGLLLT
jgi:uncharacterized SAM-binding protein YcdF (DUF218 family)